MLAAVGSDGSKDGIPDVNNTTKNRFRIFGSHSAARTGHIKRTTGMDELFFEVLAARIWRQKKIQNNARVASVGVVRNSEAPIRAQH